MSSKVGRTKTSHSDHHTFESSQAWFQKVTEKFFLACRILEATSYNSEIKQGNFRPFESSEIVICSYQFACGKAPDVANTPWDLVVIDEAHRLRNVYKPANIIALHGHQD